MARPSIVSMIRPDQRFSHVAMQRPAHCPRRGDESRTASTVAR